MENIDVLMKKYNNFKDAQIRSVVNITESSKILTLVIQDDDGEDINTIKITFSDIKESRILENGVLAYLDMMSGISMIKEHNLYGFAIGKGSAMNNVHNAPLYIISAQIDIEEK